MRSLLVFALFFTVGISARPENYIHGGVESPKFGSPFIVSIQFNFPPNFYHACGGVILTPVWILTAGTCIDANVRTDVLSGKHDLLVYEEGQQRRGVQIRSSSTSADGILGLVIQIKLDKFHRSNSHKK
jgi:hypothetical protein